MCITLVELAISVVDALFSFDANLQAVVEKRKYQFVVDQSIIQAFITMRLIDSSPGLLLTVIQG